MIVSVLIGVLFVHWLADFVMQSDWMAKNKSTSNKALAAHGLSYWYVFTAMLYPTFGNKALLYSTVNAMIHMGVDYFTSRLNKKLWGAGKVHEFFVSVGFDQFLHYVTLILTMGLLI